MGRREPRSRFLPSVYVFPGGRLDRADWGAPSRSELPAPIVRRLAPHTRAERARALAVAALRETQEETGVALGDQREGRLRPDLARLDYLGRAITPASSAIRYHARFFMARLEDEPAQPRSNGELLDLDWVPLGSALDLPMIDVTTAMLQLAREHALRPPGTRDRPRSLFIHFRGETRLVADED